MRTVILLVKLDGISFGCFDQMSAWSESSGRWGRLEPIELEDDCWGSAHRRRHTQIKFKIELPACENLSFSRKSNGSRTDFSRWKRSEKTPPQYLCFLCDAGTDVRRAAQCQCAASQSAHQQLLTCPIPSPQAVWRPETTEPSTGPFKGPRGPWRPARKWRRYHQGKTLHQQRSRGLHSALLKPFCWWASLGRGQKRWVWTTHRLCDWNL